MKRDNTVPYVGRSRPLFTMPLPWSTTQATTITVNWGRWVRSTPWPGTASLSPRKLLTWKKSTRLFWNSRKMVIIALPLLTSFKRSSHMIIYFITGYIYTNMFIISLGTYCHQIFYLYRRTRKTTAILVGWGMSRQTKTRPIQPHHWDSQFHQRLYFASLRCFTRRAGLANGALVLQIWPTLSSKIR